MSSRSPFSPTAGPATLRLVGDAPHLSGPTRRAGVPRGTTSLRATGPTPAHPDDADLRGDRRHADPVLHTTLRPRADRRSPGTLLLTWGAAIAVVSSGLAVVLGALVGRIDSARADLALGDALGDGRSQALVTAAQVSALGVVIGLVLVVAGALVRLAPRLR